MKKVLLLALCFLISTTCAFAELSQSDFEKIQSIVEKSVNASEKRIKEYVDLKIDAVNTRIDAVNESVGRNFYLITSTFALIVVAVGIPQIIIAIQSKKYDKLIDDVEMLNNNVLQAREIYARLAGRRKPRTKLLIASFYQLPYNIYQIAKA